MISPALPSPYGVYTIYEDIIVAVFYLVQIIFHYGLSAHSGYKAHFHCGQFKICRNKVNLFFVVQHTEIRICVFITHYLRQLARKRSLQAVGILPAETGS